MDFDIDRFKATRPHRDVTFWVAIGTTLAMLIPVLDEAWRSRKFPTGAQLAAASSPISTWLVLNGVIRYGSVRAAGAAVAAIAPRIAEHEIARNDAGIVSVADEYEPDKDDVLEAQAFHARLAGDPTHNGPILPAGDEPA